jgi:CheY-specific phosphatase CheX
MRAGENYLYMNNGNTNHWLEVKLRGMVSDRMAVGAKIFASATIRGNVMRQMRVITADAVEQTLVAHFGLGDATNVDLLRIEWPIGVVQELTNVVANQILTVTEHQAGATNAPSLAVSKSGDDMLQLTAAGQTNLRYAFEASTNLVQWTKIAVRTNLTGTVDYTPLASSSPQRFYRAVVP